MGGRSTIADRDRNHSKHVGTEDMQSKYVRHMQKLTWVTSGYNRNIERGKRGGLVGSMIVADVPVSGVRWVVEHRTFL